MNIKLSDHFDYKRLLGFALPSIIMMIFTSIYGIVDGFFVSNYAGKTAFAAVNLIMPLLLVLGCVGFMFTQKGVIVVDLEDKDPDELMMDALDAGADDFDAGEDAAEVTTTPEAFTDVCNALEAKGYTFISADVAQVPSTTTTLTDPDQLAQMGKLLDALDDDDDVQNAWHTLENEEDLDR